MAKIKFEIFSKEFFLSSEEATEKELENLVKVFKEKLNNLERSLKIDDNIKLLVYLSINLLDENIKLKKQSIENNFNLPFAESLIRKIEEVLNNDRNN